MARARMAELLALLTLVEGLEQRHETGARDRRASLRCSCQQ